MIEHSSAFLRSHAVAGMEIRATTKYSSEQVRSLLAEHRGLLKQAFDLRLLGCPPLIFERMLERRANILATGKQPRAAISRRRGGIVAKPPSSTVRKPESQAALRDRMQTWGRIIVADDALAAKDEARARQSAIDRNHGRRPMSRSY
jgi:hypothetical protein